MPDREENIERIMSEMGSTFPQAENTIGSLTQRLLDHVHIGWMENTERLRGVLGGHSVDEMGVMVRSSHMALMVISAIVLRDGYQLTNYSRDVVNTAPIHGDYEMEYWFLDTPYPYRIEIMRLRAGFSPIHSGMVADPPSQDDETVFGVHASFKCQNEEQYATANGVLSREFEQLMRCDSGYGKFAYYGAAEMVESWALKPRVNLRDQAAGNE